MNDDTPAGFFARWSRQKLKTQSTQVATPDRPAPATPQDIPAVVHQPGQPGESAVAAPHTPPAPPTWEDLSALTPDSDFSRFVSAEVDPLLRNAALKTLFKDPHFNVMDGLDVYIEDYGKPDPLPAGMLEQLTQSEALGLRPRPESQPEADAAAPNSAESECLTSAPPPLDSPPDSPAPPHHEDPDLRLQSDDPAGRPRAASGPVIDTGHER